MDNYHWELQKFNEQFNLQLKPLAGVPSLPPTKSGAVMVNTDVLNLRNSPITIDSTIIGQTTKGKVFYPDEVEVDSQGRSWYYIGAKKKLYLAAWLT